MWSQESIKARIEIANKLLLSRKKIDNDLKSFLMGYKADMSYLLKLQEDDRKVVSLKDHLESEGV